MNLSDTKRAPEDAEGKARHGTRPRYPLPDGQTPFDKHFEILKAYVEASENGEQPVSYVQLKGLVTVPPERVSGNNKFLESIGLIAEAKDSRGKYLPTQRTVNLVNALKWDEQRAKGILTDVLSDSWFSRSARQLLAVRQKVTRSELTAKLGFDAGADPRRHVSSLDVLVSYLVRAGLIDEVDGSLTSGTESGQEGEPVTVTGASSTEDTSRPASDLAFHAFGVPVLFGILITPETSEEAIRRAVKTVADELMKAAREQERRRE